MAQGGQELYDYAFLDRCAAAIKKCVEAGVEIALVVGAGNIWRGRQGGKMNRTRADYMGMLATTINSMALEDCFLAAGIDSEVFCAFEMSKIGPYYTADAAISAMKAGRVAILSGGSGLPYFSTDTAGALRALEIGADVMLMAKNIDGVYTDDPKKNPEAKKLESLTYGEMLARGLKAVDATSATLSEENGLPTLVFGLSDPENIYRAVMGEEIGTLITP